MKSTDIAFSRAVRTARIARGMTQGKLAVAAGVSRQFIVAIEGGHFPRSARYNALVAALGFSSPKDLMAAAETNSLSALKIALTVSASCESCGSRIPPPGARRGRPRKRCASCAADRSALGRAWRAAHGAEVAAYNAARRQNRTREVA